MESQPTKTEGIDRGKLIMTLLIAAIVISVGAVSYVVYSNSHASKAQNLPVVKAGDKVMMNYIGRFSDGRVFDTTLASVGGNNALYPKSLTYTPRGNTSYVPFNMTAGNYGSGGTIKGFALGVIGLSEGDHVIIDVPASDAYPVVETYVHTVNIVDNVSIFGSLSDTDFAAAFGSAAEVGQIYKHYFWGWDIQVTSNEGGLVIYQNEPDVGQIVYPFGNPLNATSPAGWPVLVEKYDLSANGGQGLMQIRHEVTASDVYNVKGTDSDRSTIVVSSFNATAGTFQITKSNSSTGFNGEIAGRELFFEVFILKVTAP